MALTQPPAPQKPWLGKVKAVSLEQRGQKGWLCGGGCTKLTTMCLSRLPSSLLISGATLLQPIIALTRDKYRSINLILFTFQSHLEGTN